MSKKRPTPEEAGVRFMYLRRHNPNDKRNSRGIPVACIAIKKPTLEDTHVAFQLSICSPLDTFVSEIARGLAYSRLIHNPMYATIPADASVHDAYAAVAKSIGGGHFMLDKEYHGKKSSGNAVEVLNFVMALAQQYADTPKPTEKAEK